MLRRDTYHDYIDAMALAQAGRPGADRLINHTVAELARRSGAKNVANSVLHTWRPVFADTTRPVQALLSKLTVSA